MKCPDRASLQFLLNEQLPADEFRQIEDHVEKCQYCQAVLRWLLTGAQLPLPRLRTVPAEVEGLRAEAGSTPCAGNTPPVVPAADLPRIPGYEVQAVLGRGGMGVVYKAWHTRLNRPVALKMLLAGVHAGREERERFLREAEAVAGLRHANIVDLHDVADLDGRPYFTMEYIEGGSLAKKLSGIPQPAGQAASLLVTLAEAVQMAHQGGIVHRDLKPANILLTTDGTPKITDFGLARRLVGGAGLTQSGALLGTPSYMAPEQARGQTHAIGPAVDVYALGAILYELLAGRPPFQGETPAETVLQVIYQEPVPPARLNTTVPRDLETICLKCLQKDPGKRYGTAAELAADLGRFLKHEPIQARPAGRLEHGLRWVRRRPAAAGLMAASVLLVLATGIGAWLLYQQEAAAQARQAMTDKDVRGIVERGSGLLDEGWMAQDLEKLTEVRTEGNRAVDIARSGGASARVQQEAEAFQDEAVGQCNRAEKNHAMLESLLDVSAPRETESYVSDEAGRTVLLAQLSVDQQYAAAFRLWGLDVDSTPEAEVVAQFRKEPEGVVQELIAGLDSWMLERRRQSRPEAEWRRLFRVADQLDHSERQRHLRALLVEDSSPRAVSVAGLVGAWPSWPALWELARGDVWRQLQEVQSEINPVSDPVLTVLLLAQALTAVGDAAGAEQVLREAVTARPDQVVLLDALGKLSERQGQSQRAKAIEYYRAARALRPHLGIALSEALARAGRADEGENLLRELVRRQPNDPALRFHLGVALYGQHKPREAEAACSEAIRLKPDFTLAYAYLGASLHDQEKYPEAAAAFRKAIDLQPDLAWAYNNLAVAMSAQGDLAAAEAGFRKVIALEPNSALAYQDLGATLNNQGKHREAEAACRRAIAFNPNFAEAYNSLGFALRSQGKFGAAEAAIRKAIEIRPDYARAHSNLGDSLKATWKLGEAMDQYRRAVALDPKLTGAAHNLRWTLVQLGHGEEARVAWRKALDANPAKHDAWGGYAELCLFLGQEAEYHRACKALLDRFGSTTDQFIAERTGRTCLLLPGPQDELQTAFVLIDRAVAPGPAENAWGRPYFLFAKGLAEYRQGRLDSAISLLRGDAARVLGPAPRLVLAMAQHRYGQRQEARKTLAAAVLAFDWSVAQVDNPDALVYHVLRREAENMILPSLPAFLQGKYQPQDNDERLAFLGACQFHDLRAAAVRLYADAFAADPKLAEAVPTGNRYNAAHAAVLAGCGQGKDADKLDDKERAHWRRQALEWLRQDLTYWGTALDHGDAQTDARVRDSLKHWQADPDLAGVREQDGLAKLPDEERKQWQMFWSDVDELLQRVRKPE